MKPSTSKNVFILVLLTAAIFGIAILLNSQTIKISNSTPPNLFLSEKKLNSYTSKDLKISFKYPKTWYLDEKNFNIMITSYQSSIGENKSPTLNNIKIFIDNFNGCHDSLEESLIDPACGEGGPSVPKNKIISKDVGQMNNGTFLKYIVQTPKDKFTYYFFQNNEKIIRLEKRPDPSQFEKEFEDLVSSIRFID